MILLHDSEEIDAFVAERKAHVDALKLALITNDPMRLPELFPAYATVDNNEVAKAWADNAPTEVETTMSVEEALQQLMEMGGELDIDSIGSEI